jgi:hypothetical protein
MNTLSLELNYLPFLGHGFPPPFWSRNTSSKSHKETTDLTDKLIDILISQCFISSMLMQLIKESKEMFEECRNLNLLVIDDHGNLFF